jgi:YVTN family beta-propeller protein
MHHPVFPRRLFGWTSAVVVPLSFGVGAFACGSSGVTGEVGTVASSSSGTGGHGGHGGAGSGTGGTGTGGAVAPGPVARHSSSIAVSPDGTRVYVVNADSDSVSEIDTMARTLVREIPLAAAPPTVDAGGHFTPAVGPRALALSPRAGMLYVTGERTGMLHGIDLATGKVTLNVTVGSEPVGVLVAPDESAVFVACSNDGTVVRVDPKTAAVTATAVITDGTSPLGFPIQAEPWALGWSLDSKTLYVTHMLAPNVSALDPTSLKPTTSLAIPDVPTGSSKLLANGEARGLYDVVARPGTSGEVWVPHLMLAVLTAQPNLDFESTVFPTASVFQGDGGFVTRLSTNASGAGIPQPNGAFGNVTSGPHALEFTADGKWAIMLESASEDVLAIDADGRVQKQWLHAFSGHMQEGLVLSPDGKLAYVDERNTWTATTPAGASMGGDVVVLSVDTSGPAIVLAVDGAPIPRITTDPMPAAMRHGQFLFNTANTDIVPITSNRWVACASCHVEGRTDAVTWRFLQGPRDTPSNAGGVSDTGFLFHTADRRVVTDYWQTIDNEQGGHFSSANPLDGGVMETTNQTLLTALQDIQTYVNFGIPVPVPPTTDPTLVAMGKLLFDSGDVGCSGCHSGSVHTDSGEGNPMLSLEGKINLHPVGTCATAPTAPYPDVDHADQDGNPRYPCAFPPGGALCGDGSMSCVGFDTPSLRGVASSPPYFHDGSAPTLHDALLMTKGQMGDITSLSDMDIDALVEYVRSL